MKDIREPPRRSASRVKPFRLPSMSCATGTLRLRRPITHPTGHSARPGSVALRIARQRRRGAGDPPCFNRRRGYARCRRTAVRRLSRNFFSAPGVCDYRRHLGLPVEIVSDAAATVGDEDLAGRPREDVEEARPSALVRCRRTGSSAPPHYHASLPVGHRDALWALTTCPSGRPNEMMRLTIMVLLYAAPARRKSARRVQALAEDNGGNPHLPGPAAHFEKYRRWPY